MDSFTAPVHFSAQTGAAPLLLHRERWTSSSIIPKPRRCNSVISISVFHSQAGADNVSPVWSLDKMMVLHELKSQGDTKFPAFSVQERFIDTLWFMVLGERKWVLLWPQHAEISHNYGFLWAAYTHLRKCSLGFHQLNVHSATHIYTHVSRQTCSRSVWRLQTEEN